MVFFTCSHCGESVKKPSVTKHYQTKCRKNEPFLTCIDCLKDFKGNEYEAHTKCVTEDERYSAKGFVPKPSQNKGERKQQAWQECIQTVLMKPTLKADEKELIEAISKFENVPRKKSKFINFLSNAFRQYSSKNNLIDRVWTHMESAFKEATDSNEEQNPKEQPQEKDPQNDSKIETPKVDENGVKKEKKRKKQTILSGSNEEQNPKEKPQEKDPQNESRTETPKVEENGVKKEKKRKRQAEEEKITDANDSGSTVEKMKKKKQKSNQEKVDEVRTVDKIQHQEFSEKREKHSVEAGLQQRLEVANEKRFSEIIDGSHPLVSDEMESKQKKKHKKRKAEESVPTEQNGSVLDENEPGKKKKKHDKHTEKQTNETVPDQNPEADLKTKKKSKKSKSENVEKQPDTEMEPPSVEIEGAAIKKKVKKSENKENCGEKAVLNEETNGEAEKPSSKKKKAKGENKVEEDNQETFDWKATILNVLNQDCKNKRIQLQKLQKKVLKLHCQILNCEKSEKKEKKFMKKLKEIPQIEIDNEFVVLKS